MLHQHFQSIVWILALAVSGVLCAEPATVLSTDQRSDLVEVTFHGIILAFHPQGAPGWKAGELLRLDFECVRDKLGCNFKSPYLLFVNEQAVTPVSWRFPQKHLMATVHHAPGDGEAAYDGFIVECTVGDIDLLLTLRAKDPRILNHFAQAKRGAKLPIGFPERAPQLVIVGGAEFVNVAPMFCPRPPG
jgi:hypothetical protein